MSLQDKICRTDQQKGSIPDVWTRKSAFMPGDTFVIRGKGHSESLRRSQLLHDTLLPLTTHSLKSFELAAPADLTDEIFHATDMGTADRVLQRLTHSAQVAVHQVPHEVRETGIARAFGLLLRIVHPEVAVAGLVLRPESPGISTN